ncbi:hypothetical protein L950_0232195 [Sphingobacterium sp. IITKGP-BTPF85]|nr:hypothetical protein L950_0232195 [Sphingobacterium sp. IITKGP-BTPF85]
MLSLKQQNQNSTSSVSITKVLSRMGVSVLLNWKATKSVKTETSFLLFAILETPVIKHCTGDLEEFLRQLIEQDPLVTIDIITHRYYGVGGQWVQDAGE